MRSRILAIIVASTSLALGIGAAQAEETASLTTCVDLQSKVQSALSANASSPQYQSAVVQQRYGREFCGSGLYKSGIAHYEQALRLLGADKG